MVDEAFNYVGVTIIIVLSLNSLQPKNICFSMHLVVKVIATNNKVPLEQNGLLCGLILGMPDLCK